MRSRCQSPQGAVGLVVLSAISVFFLVPLSGCGSREGSRDVVLDLLQERGVVAHGSEARGQEGDFDVQWVEVGGELRRAVWAFPGSEYRWDIEVPEGGALGFAIGIEDRAKIRGDTGVLFEVDAVVDSGVQNLFSRHVSTASRKRERRWIEVKFPLTSYEGNKVELRFRASHAVGHGTDPNSTDRWAAWANPRVFVPRDEQDRIREADIILITVDTLRPDHLGCYGYSRDTSRAIDLLAADGVLFENAFTPLNRTVPAIASLMTGLYPRANTVRTMWSKVPAEQKTLARWLKELGYVTGAVATQNASRRSGLQQGFDTYRDNLRAGIKSPRSRAEQQAVWASDWISEHRDLKFFFWLHLIDPHFRYNPPEPYDRYYDPDFQGTFRLYGQLARKEITHGQAHFRNDLTQAEVRHAIALYDGEIRYVDDVLRAFLGRLKTMGRYENALIVFASDHGESLGEHDFFFEHGEYLYDATLRIPLIVKFPRSRGRGRRISGKVMIMDIMPTVLSAAGAVDLPPLHGHDLSLYLDDAREAHPVCFAETGLNYFPENPRRYMEGSAGHWVSIRDGDFKLIKIPKPTEADYELYNIAADPGETKNLYRPGDDMAQDLAKRLEEWLSSFEMRSDPKESSKLDSETKRLLQSLGYMNSGYALPSRLPHILWSADPPAAYVLDHL